MRLGVFNSTNFTLILNRLLSADYGDSWDFYCLYEVFCPLITLIPRDAVWSRLFSFANYLVLVGTGRDLSVLKVVQAPGLLALHARNL